MHEQEQRIDKLARDVMQLSCSTLLVNLPFLDMALSQLELVSQPGILATDGQRIYYDALSVLRSYRQERERPVRDYLHMVLHCIFRHSFVDTLLNHDCWDLACDIAAENIIGELGLSCTAASRQKAQSAVLAELQQALKQLTAEKIYRYYLDQNLSPARLWELRQLFFADDHTIWYLPPQQTDGGTDGSPKYRRSGTGSLLKMEGQPNGAQGDSMPGGMGPGGQDDAAQSAGLHARAQLMELWKDIAQRMQTDLETFSRRQGDTAGNLVQNLRAVTREKYDYTAFLRKFAVLGEAMKVNDDEFDYIFYTYGMKLFGNMPLIEPLEYKEVKRIKEFVIAIDTSGSVSGDLVQKFVQKTYNILKQEESFFTKINLHIIQCDAEIQEDMKITSQEEFDRYLNTMTLRGFGGTDFRPVFAYVEELRRAGEFHNLRGLIYFTDGYGDFPARGPDYPAAFVFVDDEYQVPEVPAWVIKLVLESEDI